MSLHRRTSGCPEPQFFDLERADARQRAGQSQFQRDDRPRHVGQEEVWSYPTRAADCEDFVLEKRRRLMAMGIAAGNLLITVLRQPNGDGHAVLTVRTTRGDYLLDNLDGQIRLWSNTNYIFLKRQSEANAGVWLSINDGRDPTVASVR
jgi:predicted transglutaminase-like cysteine proteinase